MAQARLATIAIAGMGETLLSEILGRSPSMEAVRSAIARAAPDNSSCSSAFWRRKPGWSPMNWIASTKVCALAASANVMRRLSRPTVRGPGAARRATGRR